ncbi:glycerol-3-phosphate dehydrogenase, mitochondrial isoform X2 [Sitodiplosis mosellana]|uniref:glycerol-3-phosphate dehydrogenase, mitochondrial isoform X2 n=1 Tax=Sitodiplosis mosellana TaxID=263140 RepID=UPI002443CB4C|nr:glycerol-3-phosphate dehydrogenase, mitochondrial isoform X2 [Sitodiplosis mosellana]XP_055316528.1 glycerol-3-phosphate dehydrogenase, mitochondrial isoform X2 [Sitodiplosis mosellana]XP_055316529.1 glycerol-3-phosphate dehydrogenase, mitochondrial isoform X2 [Sitodiplosis mosellana]XP_055316530.1 glycerol-3-phosphate dehydrogenase, mitochondrial isoform X2 [Sitodiplosis mosellana]XP_055316531.1 glycerol-3-phosphate dehydrogenase, mitochondrial isoform X2 [Sitodiplosis mosellana]XP_0553165
MAARFRKVGVTTLGACAGLGLAGWALNPFDRQYANVNAAAIATPRVKRKLPPRSEQVKTLQSGEEYDVIIIGGGATGAGCALDSITRGLKTALIEGDDFASGTSSRSTKLIHGGVRYLQKAILGADIEQYRMVKEALHERASMLHSAPHLTHPIPIMLPVYKWWQLPYYWVGIKCYDFVAGDRNVKSSYVLSKNNALELFPMLKGDKLVGAIVYYDGQQDDARMNLAVALTAARQGATVVNHTEVTSLLKKKNEEGKEVLCGVKVRDTITNKQWEVKGKCIINATGPFTDYIRKMDDPNVKTICCPSSGVHIVLPGYYSPQQMGLLDPSTSDGRVIFFLPWQNQTIAGTTDLPCDVTHNPKPTEDEIEFILTEIKNYLNSDVEVRRGDVLSAWSGIRPLVSDPNKEDTQSLARNHIVHVSPSKLVTIAGGKWTTYRAMAEHTMDAAIKACNLQPEKESCQTDGMLLEGAHGWTPTMYIRLVQDFGLECEVAQHLAQSYGDRAFPVAKMASLTGKRWPIIGKKVHPEFPYIDAEIRYGVREYACTAIDMIARRLRLSFLNVQAAQEALPTIVDIMAEELNWSKEEKERQIKSATEFLTNEMGQFVNRASRDKIPINLSKDEIQLYIKRFQIIDAENKGYVSINDIRRALKNIEGITVNDENLHELLKEIDVSYNGRLEMWDYFQMMSAIKSGHVAYSRFARMAELEEEKHEVEKLKKKITVDRSGGGL